MKIVIHKNIMINTGQEKRVRKKWKSLKQIILNFKISTKILQIYVNVKLLY